jgi:hypothetical protein
MSLSTEADDYVHAKAILTTTIIITSATSYFKYFVAKTHSSQVPKAKRRCHEQN